MSYVLTKSKYNKFIREYNNKICSKTIGELNINCNDANHNKPLREILQLKKKAKEKEKEKEQYCEGDPIKDIDHINLLINKSIKKEFLIKTATQLGLNHSSVPKNQLIENIVTVIFLNKAATILQKNFRRYIVKVINKLKGKALFKRNICVNQADPITLSPLNEIHYYNFFSYTCENEFEYGFDIVSLYNIYHQSKKLNPFNRKYIPRINYENLKRAIKLTEKCLRYKINMNVEIDKNVSPEQEQRSRCVSVFSVLNAQSNPNWLLTLTIPKLVKLIRLMQDIWNSEETAGARRLIYPHNLLYGLTTTIDRNYEERYKLINIVLTIFERMVSSRIAADRELGAIYALGALTLVCRQAADTYPIYYSSFINYIRNSD